MKKDKLNKLISKNEKITIQIQELLDEKEGLFRRMDELYKLSYLDYYEDILACRNRVDEIHRSLNKLMVEDEKQKSKIEKIRKKQ